MVGAQRTHAIRLVGAADEHRAALGFTEEGDRLDGLLTLGVELANGEDRPHRALASIDNRQPADPALCHAVRRRRSVQMDKASSAAE